MNEGVVKMIIGSMGIKPADVQLVIAAVANVGKDIQDIKTLLADNLDVNKQILEALKKGVKK